MRHEALYTQALKAMRELFADVSVSTERTKQDFLSLKDEINIFIETLDMKETL